MTTDLELEQALRETFSVYADTVTDGPAWEGAGWGESGTATPAPSSPPRALALVETAPRFGTSIPEPAARGPRSSRATSRRWRVPLIAAAAVAAVALATAVLAPRVAHWTATPAPDGAVTTGPADVTSDTGASTLPDVTATVAADGAITVAAGQPDLVLDLYADALCPLCSDFEQHYGDVLAQAADDGKLALRYRFVDFLNAASTSGDYSTRAYAALLTVARQDGGEPGVFSRFHAALFDPATQPKENGPTDLSDGELAALAGSAGASAAAQRDIASGAAVAEARTLAATALESLQATTEAAGRQAGTPTVAVDGTPLSTNSPTWLTALLARSGS